MSPAEDYETLRASQTLLEFIERADARAPFDRWLDRLPGRLGPPLRRFIDTNWVSDLFWRARGSPVDPVAVVKQAHRWLPLLLEDAKATHPRLERWQRRSPFHAQALEALRNLINSTEELITIQALRWLDLQKRPAAARHQSFFARWITRSPRHVRLYLEISVMQQNVERIRRAGLITVEQIEALLNQKDGPSEPRAEEPLPPGS